MNHSIILHRCRLSATKFRLLSADFEIFWWMSVHLDVWISYQKWKYNHYLYLPFVMCFHFPSNNSRLRNLFCTRFQIDIQLKMDYLIKSTKNHFSTRSLPTELMLHAYARVLNRKTILISLMFPKAIQNIVHFYMSPLAMYNQGLKMRAI